CRRIDVGTDTCAQAANLRRSSMKMILNGQMVDAASGEVFEVRNPATGQSIMAALPAHQRSDILRKAADLIGDELEALSQLLTSENGKTIRQCRFEMATTQRLFADFAEEAKRIRGQYLPMDNVAGLEHMICYTVRQPVGIVVGIIPFNYPAELFAHKIPGAIAAGCSVIVKLPELCPLTVLRIGELMLQAGLPPQGMQMLTGFPQD